MPAQNMNEGNARTIVAYLRASAAIPASTAIAGQFRSRENCFRR